MMLILVVSVKHREPYWTLLRPGRIDGKIEFPLPDIKHRIFQTHTSRMTRPIMSTGRICHDKDDEFSGADIKTMCTESLACFKRV
ncbi:unnamed protein product [Musa acuminata var. zebrina]